MRQRWLTLLSVVKRDWDQKLDIDMSHPTVHTPVSNEAHIDVWWKPESLAHWAQGNTLWMLTSVSLHSPPIDMSLLWKAHRQLSGSETSLSSSFACPVGNTGGGGVFSLYSGVSQKAFLQRWNKELCMPRPEQPLVPWNDRNEHQMINYKFGVVFIQCIYLRKAITVKKQTKNMFHTRSSEETLT